MRRHHSPAFKEYIIQKITTPGGPSIMQMSEKTASMSEIELGEFLRTNGRHSTDIEGWRKDIYSTLKPVGCLKLDPELVKLRAKKKSSQRI